jgi:hypothetical protein
MRISKRDLITALLDRGDPCLDLRLTLEIPIGAHGEGATFVDVELLSVGLSDVAGRLTDTMRLSLCDPLPENATRGRPK